MANPRRQKLVRKAKQKLERSRNAVGDRVAVMEEPLRHATQLCRAIEIAYRPDDDELEALAFVASEAHSRLLVVNDALQGLYDDLLAVHED